MPAHLSPKLRWAVASVTHVATLTESSPRLVRTTSPLTPTQSPRCSLVNSSKSAVTDVEGEELDLPARVAHRGEGQLALGAQRASGGPATLTVSPDSSPSARWS